MEPTANPSPAGEVGNAPRRVKKDRHIVFVGNLPYTANADSIRKHFASLSPTDVRCLHQRADPTKCRGIAFVELPNAVAQRTCLDTLHHSLFDDGKSPARKINLELTVGGGGRNNNRMNKLRAKNAQLDLNRTKRKERAARIKQKQDPSATQALAVQSRLAKKA